MTERERLVELLDDFYWQNGETDAESDCFMYFTPFEAEIIADYLLKNGVIVPPCQVGDMVWRVDYHDQQPMEYRIFRTESDMTSMRGLITSFYANNEIDGLYFEPEDIGKTVFLTREAAEKALEEKERENNG